MDHPIATTKEALPWVFLMLLLIFIPGCSLSPVYWMHRADKYYLVGIEECQWVLKKDGVLATEITDQKVVQCTSAVKSILRERFNNARLARTAGGAIQVLTSAVSAMLTGINGASAVTAATVLSGTSSIMPELSNVIEAKDRAEVYSEGLKAIESGEARYLKAVANKFGGKVDDQKVTPDGAELYDTVFAAVHVVEARLAALLPSVEELQKLRAASETIEIAPAIVSLKSGSTEPARMQVIHGGPASTASSDNSGVASVKLLAGDMVAEIKAEQVDYGRAIITLTNSRGGKGTVMVIVEKEQFDIDKRSVSLSIGDPDPAKKKATVTSIKKVEIISATPSDPEVAKATIVDNGIAVEIEGIKKGDAVITLKNKSDREIKVNVTVTLATATTPTTPVTPATSVAPTNPATTKTP